LFYILWRDGDAAEVDAVAATGQQTYKDKFEERLIKETADYYDSEGDNQLHIETIPQFADYDNYVSSLHGGPLKSCCSTQVGPKSKPVASNGFTTHCSETMPVRRFCPM